MSITGKWVNEFGSLMNLTQQPDGSVFGTYSSTTGSSGSYWVVGFGDPTVPAGGLGQGLALSILWHSYAGGAGDPSWHYVSGLSGQLVALNSTPSLNLIHGLVATTPDPNVVPDIGSYLDKLIYTPYTGPLVPPGKSPPKQTKSAAADPAEGVWICNEDSSISLRLSLQGETTGFITGTLETAAGSAPVSGFTDTYASSATPPLSLQGLTLSAFVPGLDNTVVALAGSLEVATNLLSLAWLQSTGTASGGTWIQTNFEVLTFTLAVPLRRARGVAKRKRSG